MPQKSKKQFAAIMFTDIANFTHYMAVDEQKSLQYLENKKNKLSNLVNIYNGQYIKDIGDGTLTYFNKSSDALECALELHSHLSKKSDMEIRVGIHYGKILIIKNDIYGDDVNIASRLESLSPAGGICVSNLFLNNIGNNKKIKTDYIGLQSFKGVGRLIDVYAINHKTLNRPQLSNYSNENIKIENDEKPSLILFPFNNKGKAEDDFYAHCLSNDILSDLSNSSDIIVASNNEVEKLINKKFKKSTICKKLKTKYYITGSFWKQKNKFNLTIELVNTFSKKTIWTDSWMEEWDNLHEIKNKLVKNIFKILSNKDELDIEDNDLTQIDKNSYKEFLKAKYIFETRSSNKNYNDIENLLNKSINKTPEFVAPYLLFGDYYLAKNNFKKSLIFFEQALDISLKNKHKINIAKSLNSIGKIYYLNGRFEKASEYYNKAMEIWEQVNHYLGKADTYNLIGAIHDLNGKHKKALEFYKNSYENYQTINDHIGLCKTSFNIANLYSTSGEFDNALKYQEISFNLSQQTNNYPSIANNYNLRGILYSNTHRYKEAYELFKKALKIKKDLNDEEGVGSLYRNIGVVYLNMGLLKQSIDYFNRSLLICKDVGHNILNCHFQLSKAYKQMGSYDKSILHLENYIQIIEKTEDVVRLSEALNRLGNVYIKMGIYERALEYYKQSEKLKLKIKDELGIGFCLLGMARANSWMGNYKKAASQLNQTIKIGKKFNEYKMIADAQFYLSSIYLNKYEYKKSMNLIDKAIELANKKEIHNRIAKFVDGKGLIFKFMGQLDEALKMHKKALSLSREINNTHGIRQYLNNTGLIYEERASFEKAMEIYAECLKLSKQMNEKRSICVSYCNIGYILNFQGAFKQALKYFKRAHNLAIEIDYKAGIGGYANNMAQIYIKQNEFKKAITLLNSAKDILNDLGIADSVSCVIGKAFCYMKLGNLNALNDEVKIIKKSINKNKNYEDYTALYQLSEIYRFLNHEDSSKMYIKKAYELLLNKINKINDIHEKDFFMSTYDSQSILNNIKTIN